MRIDSSGRVRFQKGETIPITLTLRNNQGVLTNASTGVVITITDPALTAQVSAQAMTNTTTGVYTYKYLSTTALLSGEWRVAVIATHTDVLIKIITFYLEN